MTVRRLLALVLLVAMTAAACGEAGTSTTATTASAELPRLEVPARSAELPRLEVPATPAGEQLGWILDVLNTGLVTEDEVNGRFSDDFLAEISAAEVVGLLTTLAQTPGEAFVTSFVGLQADVALVAVLAAEGEEELVEVSLAVTPRPPHRIQGLFFAPARPTELEEPPQTFAEVEEQLAALAPQLGLLIAEVDEAECVPIFQASPDEALAIGSTFKLWVLGALVMAILDGRFGWDQELAISEDAKSLPSGFLHNEEEGTLFTLEEYATFMIAASDNTATDHLISLLGREAVEEALATFEHHDPALNRPFLTTREAFLLKLAVTDGSVAAYAAGDEAARRERLAELAELSLEDADPSLMATPRFIETIEWFATPADACRVLVGLEGLSIVEGLEPIRQILQAGGENLVLDPETWPHVGFKGGSEPGVLSMAMVLERADGRGFVVAMILNDAENQVDQATALLIVGAAVELLADLE